jgi:hypothetical protein
MMTINSVLMVILGCLQSMVHSVKTCGLKDVVILMTGIKIVGMKQKLKLTYINRKTGGWRCSA